MRVAAPVTLRTVMTCLVEWITKDVRGHDAIRTTGVVTWLREIAKAEPLLRVMRLIAVGAPLSSVDTAATATDTGTMVIFEGIRNALPRLSDPLLEPMLRLMLDLIQDGDTKARFGVLLTGLYEMVMTSMPMVTANQLNVMHKIAPQLTSIETLCVSMCFPGPGKRGLANVIGDNLVGLIQRALLKETALQTNSKYVFAFATDFHRVLDHAEVKQALARNPTEALALVQSHAQFINVLQGWKAVPRKTGAHVLYESLYFYNTVSFELEFIQPAQTFAEAFSGKPELVGAAADVYLRMLRAWIHDSVATRALETMLLLSTPLHKLELGDSPLAVQIPLHRAFSNYISHLLRSPAGLSAANVTDLLARASSNLAPLNILFLFEHPIQLQAWWAQVMAGLWVLNGQSMSALAAFYSSHFLDTLNQADLFLLQLAAVAVGPDAFLATLLQRYGVAGIVSPEAGMGKPFADASPQQRAAVMAGLLGTVINVLLDRTMLPPCITSSQQLRRDLLHILAIADQSHSKLFSGFSRHPPPESEQKAILSDIAEYIAPSERAGVYRLREERFEEFNPAYRLYTNSDVQLALERHAQVAGKRKFSRPLWSFGKLPDAVEPFATALGRLLRSPVLHRILAAFVRAARTADAVSDLLVASYMCLGWLIADNCPECTSPELRLLVIELIECAKATLLTSNKALADSLVALLRTFCRAFPDLDASVSAMAPAAGSPVPAGAVDKKELARRRQAALMESMKRQQQAFASKQAVDTVVTLPQAEESGTICVLCRQEANAERIAAYVAHVRKGNIPWRAKRCSGFPDERGKIEPDGTWKLPPKASHTQRSDEWNAGMWSDCNTDVPAGFHNVEEGASLCLSSCMHMVHYQCYESYFHSMADHFNGFGPEPIAP
jgi:hypothetical protein